ncbi:MAG: sulfatase [Bacteroidota bacterium]
MFQKRFILVYFIAFVFLLSAFQVDTTKVLKSTEKTYKTKYLVVFVIDGPRFTETFGDTSYSLIPRMGKELKKEGVLFTNFMNNGVTHTCPGHTAITTGVYQSITNDGKELPKQPSFLQYYLKTTGTDKSDCWVISSKGKLQVLANTKNKKWRDTFQPSAWCGLNGNGKDYVGDPETWKKIEEVFKCGAPKLTLINLLEVDVNGHQNEWEGYKKGIQNCDEYVYKFWNMIQANPKMKDQTALLVTNDHGRHLDGHKNGFVNHGDKCMGCRHISLLAMGPDFKKNVVIDKGGELIDISKTISEMFHFDMPTTKGRVLTELFEN